MVQSPYVAAIANPALAEIRDVWYWDPSIGGYNPVLTEPPTILLGSEAGAQFNVYNLSDEYLDLGLFITLFDPFGKGVKGSITGPVPIAPGGSLGNHCRAVTKFPGTYTCTVDIITGLYPYEIIGTLENVPVAYVVGELPPLAGRVYGPWVIDTTTGETFYSLDLPVEIDGGHEIVVLIHWMNEGSETAIFTPTFELVDPDGISREIQTFDTELSPGEGTGGQTGRSVVLDKAGMWKIHAILEAEGTLLDEETWNAITVTTLPPPEYAGTISKKELEYDEKRALIPVSPVPIGQSGLVHVWGRNDMATSQKLGIHWIVTDPDGLVVEDYEGWEFGTAGPSDAHEFIGGRFDINKLGTYTLEVDLLMNRANPVVVNRYQGDLCTTTTEVPPEYKLIQHTIHPAAYVWEGEAEVCVIEFPLTPEQIPFTQWGGLKLADAFASNVESEGNSLLEVWVYEDTTPMFWTNYRVEIKAAVASEEQGVAAPVWPWLVPIGAVLVKLPWGFIVKGAITLLGIWLIAWVVEKLIKAVERVFHKPSALTDEVIDSLGREDLIPMILYKAPRVDYEVSPEELEGMTDDGLRALLKDLRDREKEFEWWPLVLIGAAGVLGVGAAIALTAGAKPPAK